MKVRSALAALTAMFCASGATAVFAADDTVVETVAGYEVSRVNESNNAHPCRIVRTYLDPQDGNAANVLAFGRLDDMFIVSLAHQNWKWEKGKFYKSRFSIDDQLIDANAEWLGNGTNLVIKVPDRYLSMFKSGRRIVLKMRKGSGDFDLTGFEPAYEALLRCDRNAKSGSSGVSATIAPAPAPAPAPATTLAKNPLPSDARIGAYYLGLYLEDIMNRCDVATTQKQRNGFAARMASLRPEMTEVDAAARAVLKPEACPAADDKDNPAAISLFADRSPEEFAAIFDKLRGGLIIKTAQTIAAKVRPQAPTPSEPRMAAYLYGLVLQEKIASCDLATTTRQRKGLDAKIAALQPEMAAVETALRDQIKGQVEGCPKADKLAEMEAALTAFVDMTPEAFAAEMDRRTAARQAAAAPAPAPTPAPAPSAAPAPAPVEAKPVQEAKSDPPAIKAPACTNEAFPQSRVALVRALSERFKPFGATAPKEGAPLKEQYSYRFEPVDVSLVVQEEGGRVVSIDLVQYGNSSKQEAPAIISGTSYAVAAFNRVPGESFDDQVQVLLDSRSPPAGWVEKFGPTSVYLAKDASGHVSTKLMKVVCQ